MKTAIDDQILMPNLSLPMSKGEFFELLETNNIKPIVKKIANREIIHFSHDILFVQAPGLALECSQQIQNVKIFPMFDDNGMLKGQHIKIGYLYYGESSIGQGYELLEPFLHSFEWNILRKEEDPSRKGHMHRISKYLLENESKGLLLLYNQGDALTFENNDSKEQRLTNPSFWNSWSRNQWI